MMNRNFLLGFVGLVTFAMAPLSMAMDPSQVRQSMETFMVKYSNRLLTHLGKKTRVEYSIGAFDPSLVIGDCLAPLHVEVRDQAGQVSSRINLEVSCRKGTPWALYIPVDMSIYTQVVVSTRPLGRGDGIQEGDVELQEAEVGRLNGQYLATLDGAIGLCAKHFLPQGSILGAQALDEPLVIKRGDAVLVSANTDIVSVKMPGIALMDGRRGEQIRIKNKTSAKIVDAQVMGPGEAQVSM